MTLIGGGLVGCELANDFANAGIEVTLLDVQDLPLQSRIGLQQASGLRDALQDIGVRWMGSAQVEQITAVQTLAKSCFTGNPVASPTAVRLQIRTADGATTLLDADIAVACLGVVPRTRLATACGLNTQRGIVVNPQTLAAAPGVFALGDCIEINGELSSTIAPMTAQARCIASQISGKPENYAPVRSPWIVKTPCFPIHIQ
jgi:rubredoxin-NAD+ reductase